MLSWGGVTPMRFEEHYFEIESCIRDWKEAGLGSRISYLKYRCKNDLTRTGTCVAHHSSFMVA